MKMLLLFATPLRGSDLASKEFITWNPGAMNYGVNKCSQCIISGTMISCASNAADIHLYMHSNSEEKFPTCTLDDGTTAKQVSEPVRLFESVNLPNCDATKKGNLWSTVNSEGCAPFAEEIIVPRSARLVTCGRTQLSINSNLDPNLLAAQNSAWLRCKQPGLENIRPNNLGPSCQWKQQGTSRYSLACIPNEFEKVTFKIIPRDQHAKIEVNDRPLDISNADGANLRLYDVPPFPWTQDVTDQVDSTPQWMQWIDDSSVANANIRIDVGCGCPLEEGVAQKPGTPFPNIVEIQLEKLPVSRGSLDQLAVDSCLLHPEFDPAVLQYVVICEDQTFFHLTAETGEDLIINNRVLSRGKSNFKIDVYRNVPTVTTFKVVSATPISDCTRTEECTSVHGPNSICAGKETCRLVYGTYSIATIGGSAFDTRTGMLLKDPSTGHLVANYAKLVPTIEGKTMPRHGPPHMSFDCKRCDQCTTYEPLEEFHNMNLRTCLERCRRNPICKYISHSYPTCRLSAACPGVGETTNQEQGRWTRYHAIRATRQAGVLPPPPRPDGTVVFLGQPGTQDCIIDLEMLDKLDIPHVNAHLSTKITCLPSVSEVTLYFTGKGVIANQFVCDDAKVAPRQMHNRDTPAGSGTVSVVYGLSPNRAKDETQTMLEAQAPQCRGKHQSFSLEFNRKDTRRAWMEHKLADGFSPRCRSAKLLNIRHDYPVDSSNPKPQDCVMRPAAFDPGLTRYAMSCPQDVASVSFSIVVADPSARVLVDGTPIDSDEIQWQVAQRDNPLGAEFAYNTRLMFSGSTAGAESKSLNVLVSCENEQLEYSVSLERGVGLKPEISALVIGEGGDACKLTPKWQSSVYEYDIYCPEETTWITLQPRVPDQSSRMLVNEEIMGAGDELDPVELDFGGTHRWTIEMSSPLGLDGKPMGGYGSTSMSTTYVITAHRAAPVGLSGDSTKIMASIFSTVGITLAIMSGANFMQVAKFLQFLALMVAIQGTPQGFCMFAKSFSALNLQFGKIDSIFPALKKYMPFDVVKFKKRAALAAGLPAEAVEAILDQEKSMETGTGITAVSDEVKALRADAAKQVERVKAIQKQYKKQYEQYKKNFAKEKKQFLKQKSLLINLFLLPAILTLLLIYYGAMHVMKSFRLCGFHHGSAQVAVNEFRPSFLLLFILDIGLIGFIRSSTDVYFKGAEIQVLIPLGSHMITLAPDKQQMETFVLILFLLYPVGFLAFSLYNLYTMRQRIVYNKNLGKYVDRECVEIKAVQDVPMPVPFLGKMLARCNFSLHYNITQVSPIKWIHNSEGKFIFTENERESMPEIGIILEKRNDNSIFLYEYGQKTDDALKVVNGDQLLSIDADDSFHRKGIQYIRKLILNAKEMRVNRGNRELTLTLPVKDVATVRTAFRRFSLSVYKSLEEGVHAEENEDEKKGAQIKDREEFGFDVPRTDGSGVKVGKNFDVRLVVLPQDNKTYEFNSRPLPTTNQDLKREVTFSAYSRKKTHKPQKCKSEWQGDKEDEKVKGPYYAISLEDERDINVDCDVRYTVKENEEEAPKDVHLLHRVYLENTLMEPSCFGLRARPVPHLGPELRDEKDVQCPLTPVQDRESGWFMRRIAVQQIPEKVVGQNLDHVSSMVLNGFASCKRSQSQLIVLLRDDDNAVHGTMQIESKNRSKSSIWRKEAKEWGTIEGPKGGSALSVQHAVRRWLADAATKTLQANVPEVTETDVHIKTWTASRGGVITFTFSITLKQSHRTRGSEIQSPTNKAPLQQYIEEDAAEYSMRSNHFFEKMKLYLAQDEANNGLNSDLAAQGFNFLKTSDPPEPLHNMELEVSTKGLFLTDIKERDVLIKRISKRRTRVDITKEYEGSPVLKNACSNDRLEIWIRGPATEGNEVLLELKKAVFTANVGTHSQQKYVRICLDSEVFRGEEQLKCRASVQQPNDLIRFVDAPDGYEPLTEEADDKIKLMKGMSPAGVPYRLSPIYDEFPQAKVGTKTFPISVLGQNKTGKYGYRLVSDIKVKEIPRLHWYCPNYEIDVPQDQLIFPESDTWSHYYGGMKENQRMHWVASRSILLFSICLVAFYGTFKEHFHHQISHTKDLIKHAVNDETSAISNEVGDAVHSAEDQLSDAVHKNAHQAVREGNGFAQATALLVGTSLVLAISAYAEIGSKFSEKEDDRMDEQDNAKFSYKNFGRIWSYYTRPENKWWWFQAIWEGESFMYLMEVALLLVLMAGMDGPMHIMWKDLSSYLLIFIAGYTILVTNIRFIMAKMGEMWENAGDFAEKIKTKAVEFTDSVKEKIEFIKDLPSFMNEQLQALVEQVVNMQEWIRETSYKIQDAMGMVRSTVDSAKQTADDLSARTPMLMDTEAPPEEPVSASRTKIKRGSVAHREMLELVESTNDSFAGKCKNLFCARQSIDDLPREVAIQHRKSFQQHVEEHNQLLTSWSKGETVFEATPDAVLKSALASKGEHKITAEKTTRIHIADDDIEKVSFDINSDELLDVQDVMFESVDLIVDSIGMKLSAQIVPDKHAYAPRKRLARIQGGVRAARDLVTKMPIQIEYEDFVDKFSAPRTLIGTIQVVNCAKVKNVDKPENDSYLSLYTSNTLQMNPESMANECARWFLQILNWAEKQGGETIRASKLNNVLDALFWGRRKVPAEKTLLQQYLAQKMENNEHNSLIRYLSSRKMDAESGGQFAWKGFEEFFLPGQKRPTYVGELVKSLQKISVKPELLHVVIRAEDMRPPPSGSFDPYLWNPPMIQAIQAEKFEITPMKVGIGAPGMLRLFGDKFTFVHPLKIGGANLPITEEYKFEYVQSILANTSAKYHNGRNIPGETLYVLTNNGPVIAFVLSKENIVMWEALVNKFGLNKAKPSIFGHEGPTIRHPTEAGVRLRHGATGSQTWYIPRNTLTSFRKTHVESSHKHSLVKDLAPEAFGGLSGLEFPVEEGVSSQVLAKAGGILQEEEAEKVEAEKGEQMVRSSMMMISEQLVEEDRSERVEKGRYEGGWSLHQYHDGGAIYRHEYATKLGKGMNFLDYLNFDWENVEPKFQREICVYEGTWKAGKRHGKGTILFPLKGKWYVYNGLYHEDRPLFGHISVITDDKTPDLAIEEFLGCLKRIDPAQMPKAEFPWLSSVEMFVALTRSVTSGADEVEKMTVGEIMHKINKMFEDKGGEAVKSATVTWNKSLKLSDAEVSDLTTFDTFCLNAILDHLHVLPTVEACLSAKDIQAGLSNTVIRDNQPLKQKLPRKAINEKKGDTAFVNACIKLWFQYDGPCFTPPSLSVDETDKKASAMEVIKYLPKNTPIATIKLAIGAAMRSGNDEEDIRSQLKKKFNYTGDLPPGKEKVVTGIMSEDLDKHKSFVRQLQAKYTAMMRIVGDYGVQFSEQLTDALSGSMPLRRRSSLEYKSAATVSVKGTDVQDAMNDEAELGLYQYENDRWLQGEAFVSMQPDMIEGYVELKKDQKIGFKGRVRDGLLTGTSDMMWENKAINSEIIEGKINGKCTISHNGAVFEGDVIESKRHGKGKFTSGSYQYDGDWKDDIRHGEGTLDTASFCMKGTFVNDEPTAFDEYRVKDQGNSNFKCTNKVDEEIQSSEFEFLIHGQTTTVTMPMAVQVRDEIIPYSNEAAELKDPKGKVIYSGGIENSVFGPRGVFNLDEYTYEGQLKDGMRHGTGKMELGNLKLTTSPHPTLNGSVRGTTWDGPWKKDKPDGYGKLKFVLEFAEKGVFDVLMTAGVPSADPRKKGPICFRSGCCKGGDVIPDYPKEIWSVAPPTPHLPGGGLDNREKGFAFSIQKQSKAPYFDLAEAANVPDNLLHKFFSDMSDGLVSNEPRELPERSKVIEEDSNDEARERSLEAAEKAIEEERWRAERAEKEEAEAHSAMQSEEASSSAAPGTPKPRDEDAPLSPMPQKLDAPLSPQLQKEEDAPLSPRPQKLDAPRASPQLQKEEEVSSEEEY